MTFKNRIKKPIRMANLLFAVLALFGSCNQSQPDDELSAYLFTYFTGNGPGEEAIHFAVSLDGYNYRALNNNKPILDSKEISTSGGVRDPHILRGADGWFYMVVTDLYVPDMGWKNYAMVLLKSKDLINWESSKVNIPETFPEEFGDVWRVWAPQTFYDETTGKYMIYFSMKQGDEPDIIYYAFANEDFTGLEAAPQQLFYSPTDNAAIDGDIILKDGTYHLFMKSEDGEPGIKLALSDQLTEGYELVSDERVDCEDRPVEGSGIFKLIGSDEYILMYDVYTSGRYQFTKSSDLQNFSVIDESISMNFHPRHGTVLPITGKELKQLIRQWGQFDDLLIEAQSASLKKQNVVINGNERTIELPLKRGTDLSAFDPEFSAWPGIDFHPKGAQDFSGGAVEYIFSIDGKGEVIYQVSAAMDHNPVLEGYYADPDILYSKKTGKYYIYPTSDGFMNWSGTYFKVFSSDNLVDWTDEGVILDLKTDVSWTDRNAWAPCIIEKKIDGEYKYFYYFTAAQKIGLAVADDPTGPFVDSGQPLIDYKPEGITGGQEIDADVFTDPESGKSYLYWGNGYMAAAELSEDMLSIKKNTLKLMNIDNTYREGTYVIYRNGTYYFMWSEDDTRSPNYKVRYATSDSPLGTLTIPENNIVIRQDAAQEIFATGHNSAIQVPGKDEWYLVYHRFTRPKGIDMGRAGGFHREVCIDKLEFDENGGIIEVKPTIKGIEPVN
ncbi:family 43 glycosylhydrolase [Gaoshiqia sediminis]|uniref:Family 43 glycosylhydrolase n=1 Tax=Gaoshiqia sediminis TaxID=2986998 RepID=A0AA41Y8A8_9BACT|nr:family 43 glycosylhydrolase [Gaoshiqia sediminis]MCW0483022.1 family 43 glycosylhydrolase [Gaoshiqia sediminis]